MPILIANLANFCHSARVRAMTTMNISLPEMLKSFVDEQVAGRGFGTSSEFVRALIRKDQDRQTLRRLLLDGAESVATHAVEEAYSTACATVPGGRCHGVDSRFGIRL